MLCKSVFLAYVANERRKYGLLKLYKEDAEDEKVIIAEYVVRVLILC